MVSDRPFPAIQEDNQDTRTVEVEEDLQDVFDSLLKVSTHMRRILMKLKRIKEKSPSLMTFDHPGVFTRTTSGSDFEWRLESCSISSFRFVMRKSVLRYILFRTYYFNMSVYHSHSSFVKFYLINGQNTKSVERIMRPNFPEPKPRP